VCDQLDSFVPAALHAEGGVELDTDRWHAVLNDVSTLRETAEQMDMIAATATPGDHALAVTIDEIAGAAAEALMEGNSDLSTVELAVRLLDRERGFPALAFAIELDPLGSVAGWDETTVGELLNAFRDGNPRRTAAVCAAAGVNEEARWAGLGWGTLLDVCASLRLAANQS